MIKNTSKTGKEEEDKNKKLTNYYCNTH